MTTDAYSRVGTAALRRTDNSKAVGWVSAGSVLRSRAPFHTDLSDVPSVRASGTSTSLTAAQADDEQLRMKIRAMKKQTPP
ncbi:MAG: hypothetical protein ACSLE1_05260 [Sphingobium sp.]